MADITPSEESAAPIFTKNGAFITRGENPSESVVYGASLYNAPNGLTYLIPEFIDGKNLRLSVGINSLTIDKNTGTIDFVGNGVNHTIREFREEDGYWVSRLSMPLSVSILNGLVENDRSKNTMSMTLGSDVPEAEEALIAYAFNDSLYIVGLVYTNDLGRWIRVDGDWVMLANSDNTFVDALPIEIDSERSDEYVRLYDANYVPVADTEDFEAPQSATVPAKPTEK
jgi:hypothetical protein